MRVSQSKAHSPLVLWRCGATFEQTGENAKVGGREGAVAPDKVGEGTTE